MASFSNRFDVCSQGVQALKGAIAQLREEGVGTDLAVLRKPHLDYALERAQAASIPSYEHLLQEGQGQVDADAGSQMIERLLRRAELALQHGWSAFNQARDIQLEALNG